MWSRLLLTYCFLPCYWPRNALTLTMLGADPACMWPGLTAKRMPSCLLLGCWLVLLNGGRLLSSKATY